MHKRNLASAFFISTMKIISIIMLIERMDFGGCFNNEQGKNGWISITGMKLASINKLTMAYMAKRNRWSTFCVRIQSVINNIDKLLHDPKRSTRLKLEMWSISRFY